MACGAALGSIRTYTKMRFSVMSAKNGVQGPDICLPGIRLLLSIISSEGREGAFGRDGG